MSYIPERDTYNDSFKEHELKQMWDLAEEMEDFYLREYHKDSCSSFHTLEECEARLKRMYYTSYSVSAYEAIMYLTSLNCLEFIPD